MSKDITTISIKQPIKDKAQRASKQVFGYINLSAYIKLLIDKDCSERGIK